MNNSNKFVTSLITGVSALALPAAAMAEAPDAAPTADNSTIIVTALKRSESILKVPAAITAIAGDELRNLGVNTVSDVQNVVPGVTIQSGQDGLNIGIRGVRASDTSSKGEADIGFNVDGVYIGRGNARGGAFFDIERVEVLRGPQGTLYGRSTTGGTINLITNKPRLHEASAYVRLEYGNYDTKRGEAAINLPLGDTVAVRFSGAFNDRDGYANPVAYAPVINGVTTNISTVGAKALNDQHDATGRASMLFQPSPDVTARLTATFGHQGGLGGTNQVESFLTSGSGSSALNVYATPYPSFVNNNTANLDGTIKAKIGAVQLDVMGSYQHFSLDQQRANTNNVLQNASGMFGGILQIGRANTTQFELRLSNAEAAKLDYVVGANYFHEDIYESGRLWNAPVATALDTTTWSHNFEVDNHTPHTAYGVFAQGTYHLTDQLGLVAGVRYTHDKVQRTGQIDPGPCFVVNYPDQCPAGQEFIARFGYNDTNNGLASDSKVTWKAGLNYQLTPKDLLFASVATGFKAGGFNDFSITPGHSTSAYTPASITAYEIGYKGRPAAGLTLASDLFYYDFSSDQITGVIVYNPPAGASVQGQFTFTPAVEIYGWENELGYSFGPNTRINVTAAYMHSKYKNLLVGPVIGSQVSWSGFALDQTPDFVATASIDHSIDLGRDSQLKLHAQIKYSDKYVLSDFSNELRYWQPSSTRSAANVTYAFAKDHYAVQLFVENIENKVQRTSGIGGYSGALGGGGPAGTYGNGTNAPAGYLNFSTNTPRFFGVRFNGKF